MTEMTDDIFKRSRAGLDYMEFKLREYEREIARLTKELQIVSEELARERSPKFDER